MSMGLLSKLLLYFFCHIFLSTQIYIIIIPNMNQWTVNGCFVAYPPCGEYQWPNLLRWSCVLSLRCNTSYYWAQEWAHKDDRGTSCLFRLSLLWLSRSWTAMVRPQRTFYNSWVTLGSNLSVFVGLWFVWHRSKYGQGNLEGNRFRIHKNGTLEIKRIQIEDQGTYLCVISNIAGRDENQVRVEVKGKDDTENLRHQEALLTVWQ